MHSSSKLVWLGVAAWVGSLSTVAGCDKAAEAVGSAIAQGVEAGDAASDEAVDPDQQLGEKLNAYIGCLNGPSGRMHDVIDRYRSWVDFETGVTGKEKNVRGIPEIKVDETCVKGIATAKNMPPSDPELEAAADAWLAAYQGALPIFLDAHNYYHDEDYKDDDFAKAKAFHPQIAESVKNFDLADATLRQLVHERNDALAERELARLEKETGRKLQFQTANVMAHAKFVLEAAEPRFDEKGEASFDLEATGAAAEKFEKAFEEAEAYVAANTAEAKSLATYSMFMSASKAFRKSAKAFVRRQKEGKPLSESERMRIESLPQTVDGSFGQLNALYNDLVNRSNSLSWTFYEPHPQ